VGRRGRIGNVQGALCGVVGQEPGEGSEGCAGSLVVEEQVVFGSCFACVIRTRYRARTSGFRINPMKPCARRASATFGESSTSPSQLRPSRYCSHFAAMSALKSASLSAKWL